jgi:preprotein translocase subunit SecB
MPKNKRLDSDEQTQRQVVINAQYIKDLSFENPGAPVSLVGNKETPKIDVSVDVQIGKLADTTFEVALTVSANAAANDKKMFLVELTYAGVFSVAVPAEELEPVLMIYCPNMLFPYARRIVSDTVRDGGFPPLMLDPIDFAALYQNHKTSDLKQKKSS